jgi:tryptophan-rich hypothetical protein
MTWRESIRSILESYSTASGPRSILPARKKPFVVTDVAFDEDGAVLHCLIEAVISRLSKRIDWRQLKNRQHWLQGWK